MITDANGMPVLQPLVDDASTATFNAAFAQIGVAVVDKLPLRTYRWATASARVAQTGMQDGDTGYQENTDTYYLRLNGSWVVLYLDTGWVDAPLAAGLSGSARYRRIGPTAEIRFDISGSLTSNLQLTQPLPAHILPGPGVPDTLAVASYVNSPSSGASAFISNDTATLRFVGTGSRVRGGGQWFVV